MECALSLRTLSKSYGEVEALKGVSLDVQSGEMFALIGPDGAGKTTLLRIISGVLRPDRGEIEALGLRLPGGRKALRNDLGYLSQGFSLYRDLSVEENLRFRADIYGVRHYRKHRDQLLGFTRLEPFADRLAGRLSGGMKKKLALACALIHQPKLLLLDEPTTGVDPVSRRDFWLILGELLTTGLTIVVTSPYLDEAERCHRVGLLREGEFLFVGTPEDARTTIEGDMVEVVCTDPRRARKIIERHIGAGVVEAYLLGDRLNLRLPSASNAEEAVLPTELRASLEAGGVGVIDARRITPTLENVYLSLVAYTPRTTGGTP